jgi:hypothetical protein
MLGEHLGLAELGRADAAGAGLDLGAGDIRALVGLGVRSQAAPAFLHVPRHLGQVRLEPVEVEQQGRRAQVVLGDFAGGVARGEQLFDLGVRVAPSLCRCGFRAHAGSQPRAQEFAP